MFQKIARRRPLILCLAVLCAVLPARAQSTTCLNATAAAMNAFTDRIVEICRADYQVKASRQAVHALAENTRDGKDYSAACLASCRRDEDPFVCGKRFVDDFQQSAVASFSGAVDMAEVCQRVKGK